MKVSELGRCAFCISIAAAMLAGCGLQPPIGAPGAMPQSPAIAPGHSLAHHGTSSYQVLFRFRRQRRNGAYPDASLIDVNGTLFGTAASGPNRGGIIYSMRTTGEEEVLYGFGALYGELSPLVDVNGTLYGTSEYGGAYYDGAVYSITTTGTYTLLYSFKGGPDDGAGPRGGLLNVNGTLYGTTAAGGTSACPWYTITSKPQPCGTVYSITTTGKEKVLYAFTSREGWFPLSGLINVKGTLYGTTAMGGTGKCGLGNQAGCGTVYSITTTGTHRLLYSFTGIEQGGTDGENPIAGLTEVKGRLYGTTRSGGTYEVGTVYSITTAGKEKVIHSFRADSPDGNTPLSGLVDVHGTLYGMTLRGGTGSRCVYDYGSGCGTVYSVSTTGTESVLHSFGVDPGDGALPEIGGLTYVNGALYGTTANGGAGECRAGQQHIGCGTVFSLSL